MAKRKWFTAAFGILAALFMLQHAEAKTSGLAVLSPATGLLTDTVPPQDALDVIYAVIRATNKFDIETVADLYTPNAVVADDEPPYSWNGPTAGVQWINAVEIACKNNRITKLRGRIEPVSLFQQSADNIYIVLPVSFVGDMPHKQRFHIRGAFTFVLRQVNGKWLIKSQVWMQERGMTR